MFERPNGNLSVLEFIAWVVVMGLLVFTVDVWLSRELEYRQIKQVKTSYQITKDKWEALMYGPSLEFKREWCKSDKECAKMAEALVYEARGESELGAVAIAFVILERVNAKRWPDTIVGVVNQRKQFSYVDYRQKISPVIADWKRAYVLSYDVLHGNIESPIDSADHYHAKYVSPSWAKQMQYVADVGNHKFYKEN